MLNLAKVMRQVLFLLLGGELRLTHLLHLDAHANAWFATGIRHRAGYPKEALGTTLAVLRTANCLALRASREYCAVAVTILRPQARPAFLPSLGGCPFGRDRAQHAQARGRRGRSPRCRHMLARVCVLTGGPPPQGGGRCVRDRNKALRAGRLHLLE